MSMPACSTLPIMKDGPKDGPVAILLHGFPYGILSYADVAGRDRHVIVPYLRGFGATRTDPTYSAGPAKSDAGRTPSGSHFHRDTGTRKRRIGAITSTQRAPQRKLRSDLSALRGGQQRS